MHQRSTSQTWYLKRAYNGNFARSSLGRGENSHPVGMISDGFRARRIPAASRQDRARRLRVTNDGLPVPPRSTNRPARLRRSGTAHRVCSADRTPPRRDALQDGAGYTTRRRAPRQLGFPAVQASVRMGSESSEYEAGSRISPMQSECHAHKSASEKVIASKGGTLTGSSSLSVAMSSQPSSRSAKAPSMHCGPTSQTGNPVTAYNGSFGHGFLLGRRKNFVHPVRYDFEAMVWQRRHSFPSPAGEIGHATGVTNEVTPVPSRSTNCPARLAKPNGRLIWH